jgi:hypothetical protein
LASIARNIPARRARKRDCSKIGKNGEGNNKPAWEW